jgi:hypothetical protein
MGGVGGVTNTIADWLAGVLTLPTVGCTGIGGGMVVEAWIVETPPVGFNKVVGKL